MKLRDIVIEKAIIPDLQSTTRDDVIAEMIDALVDAGSIVTANRDAYIKSVVRREKRGSTGFGRGVAVPHIKDASINAMHVAIGISQEGIDFNALDRMPVHSIFLLLSPEDKPEDHLDAMEAIFTNLQQDTFRRFLHQARSVDDVLTLLQEADEQATAR